GNRAQPDALPHRVRSIGRVRRPRGGRHGAPGPGSRPPRGRRNALPAGHAPLGGGDRPADSDRHGEVTPALRARRVARARGRRAVIGPGNGSGRDGRMTSQPRFERNVSALLEDLYLGPSPSYRDDLLAAARRTGQRPAWSFPERWLPVDIANRRAFAPRYPA